MGLLFNFTLPPPPLLWPYHFLSWGLEGGNWKYKSERDREKENCLEPYLCIETPANIFFSASFYRPLLVLHFLQQFFDPIPSLASCSKKVSKDFTLLN